MSHTSAEPETQIFFFGEIEWKDFSSQPPKKLLEVIAYEAVLLVYLSILKFKMMKFDKKSEKFDRPKNIYTDIGYKKYAYQFSIRA